LTFQKALFGALFLFGAPSMSALLEVQVLPQADHTERSEAQLRKVTDCGKETWIEPADSRAVADLLAHIITLDTAKCASLRKVSKKINRKTVSTHS
jgi:hypothetical protein